MKVELNIEKDEDLRKYIKSLIKVQVEAITRDEIRTCIKELLESEKAKTTGNLNKGIDAYIKTVISDLINSRHNLHHAINTEIKNQVADYVHKVLKKDYKDYGTL